MGQLSKATQQNASASEELAATSEELSGQAEQLQQSVAFFNLATATARAGAQARRPRRGERRAPNSPMRGSAAQAAAPRAGARLRPPARAATSARTEQGRHDAAPTAAAGTPATPPRST